jgi:DNA-binding FadR family transcriptional regulator
MKIAKTKRVSLVEQVVVQIESLIEKGEWPIGTRIPAEMELMIQFDVSRNTLREAIRALVHAGLLQTKQGSGTYVRSNKHSGTAFEKRLAHSTLIEILEVRHALEREAASLAAERRTEQDVEALNECLIQCKNAKDLSEFATADIELHKAIIRASHNRPLIELYTYHANALHDSVYDLNEMTAMPDEELDPGTHDELIDAIIEQNRESACTIVTDYINRLKKIVLLNGESKL